MEARKHGTVLAAMAALFLCCSLGYALTFDFVGPEAQKWFDEFVGHANVGMGGGDAGWHLTGDGLTTDDNVGTAHQRIGIFEETWEDYTLESMYQYISWGSHKEAHLYVRWVDEGNNYYFRTIGRDNAGSTAGYSIEWLRKVGGSDNEGDITDDDDIVGELEEGEIYGLRGEISDQLLKVDFFKDGEWKVAGEIEYPGPHDNGGIGVARSSAEVAWQYLRVNGDGIPADNLPVEALDKLATTWAKVKTP